MRDAFSDFLREVGPQWDTPATAYVRLDSNVGWQRFGEYSDPYHAIMPLTVLGTREAMLVMYGNMTPIETTGDVLVSKDTERVMILLYAEAGREPVIATRVLGEALRLSGDLGHGEGLFQDALEHAQFVLSMLPELSRNGLLPSFGETEGDDD